MFSRDHGTKRAMKHVSSGRGRSSKSRQGQARTDVIVLGRASKLARRPSNQPSCRYDRRSFLGLPSFCDRITGSRQLRTPLETPVISNIADDGISPYKTVHTHMRVAPAVAVCAHCSEVPPISYSKQLHEFGFLVTDNKHALKYVHDHALLSL